MLLLIVKRSVFEQFAAGTKTIEYRRHRGHFTARTFRPGRKVSIGYNYDPKKGPRLEAQVARFAVVRAAALEATLLEQLRSYYPELAGDDEIAVIGLRRSIPAAWG